MKKKEEVDWIKYPENKPQHSQIVIVVSYKNSETFYLDQYSTEHSKRILKKNDEKKIQWGTWKYKEECEQITEEHIIYRKIWNFFDEQNNPIHGVTHYLQLPKFPEYLYENKPS